MNIGYTRKAPFMTPRKWYALFILLAILAVAIPAGLIFSRGGGGEVEPVFAEAPESVETVENGYISAFDDLVESDNQYHETIPEEPTREIVRLAFVGDVMCHGPQLEAARVAEGVYDFNYAFRYIAPYIQAADFAIANLETTLTHGRYAGWPLFRSPRGLAEALLNAGFDYVTTGNNHSFDDFVQGVHSTMEILDDVGLGWTGTFRTPACRYEITVVEVGGFTFALLNFTMHVNGLEQHNMSNYMWMVKIVYHDLVGQSRIDYEMIRASMARARALETDFIIVLPHIGIEYYGTMNRAGGGHQWDTFDRNDGRWVNWMRTMNLFLDEGADMVMNHHPHTLLPAEFVYVTNDDGTVRRAFMAYSMANFVSAQRREPRETSAVFYVDVARDDYGNAYIYAASYVPIWVREHDPTRYPLRCFTVLPVASTLQRVENEETPDLRPQDIQRLHQVYTDVTYMLSGEPRAFGEHETFEITRYRTREQFPGLPLWGTLPWR